MYLASVIVLLSAALLNAESNNFEQLYEPCNGGYCVPKHFCPTGRIDDLPILGQIGVIPLQVDEVNECGDFMQLCCKKQSTMDECGISNPQGLVYDVESNLTYAKYAEFPWTVAIFQKPFLFDDPELIHVGGGILIHPKYILMAAHTFKDSHRYVARFGEWNMKSDAEIYESQDIEIEEYILHPYFHVFAPLENDIALALLGRNVIFSDHIRPLCLPSAKDAFDGQKCIATGWGVDVRTGQPAPIMKRIELDVISREHCQMLYRSMNTHFRLHRSIICADAAEDQNIWLKDGGSPLACQREDGSYVLAGIASLRTDYQANSPGFYVNVAKFVCWIHDTIEEYDIRLGEELSEVPTDLIWETAPLQMQHGKE